MAKPETHTSVDITVRLANGHRHHYAWTTPLSLTRATGKAIGWARRAMSEARVPGRSRIDGWTVSAETWPGPFTKADHR